MANVYVEPRPKGRPEGTAIDDYVVEDHADHVLTAASNPQKVSEMKLRLVLAA
jgi:hypothetical protein